MCKQARAVNRYIYSQSVGIQLGFASSGLGTHGVLSDRNKRRNLFFQQSHYFWVFLFGNFHTGLSEQLSIHDQEYPRCY